jgi:acyl-CoA synthetase (AMP-forming)/AMP-acid ligase II
MHNPKLILDYVYGHEAAQPDEVLLVQPIGGGQVVEYTWRQMLDEARRMAANLKSRDFEPGARIAILSKGGTTGFAALRPGARTSGGKFTYGDCQCTRSAHELAISRGSLLHVKILSDRFNLFLVSAAAQPIASTEPPRH